MRAERGAAAADVCVAGVARSGSTALAMLMGTDPRVAVIGESWQLPRAWESDAMCGCGHSLRSCSFWGPVSELVPLYDFSAPQAKWLRVAVRQVHGASLVVDTSNHAAFLRTSTSSKDVLVHLVRDPRGHVLSRYRGWSTKRVEGLPAAADVVRTSLHWSRVNALAAMLRRQRSGILLRYEDFVMSPVRQASHILARAGLDDFSPTEGVVQHLVAGNPIRKNPNQNFEIRADFEWHSRLPSTFQLTSSLAALPLSAAYGYPAVRRERDVPVESP